MDLQAWAVVAVVLVAFVYLSATAYRGWKRIRSGGCSSSCGCEVKGEQRKQPGLVQVDDLTARLRARSANR